MRDYWQEQANCRGMDTNIFFPELGKSHLVMKTIKEVCGPCPVKEQCLELGMHHEVRVGFYGGLSGVQRRVLKSKRDAERRARRAV